MIKIILSALVALGVGGPTSGDFSHTRSAWPRNSWPIWNWSQPQAKVGMVRTSEDGIVSGISGEDQAVMTVNGRGCCRDKRLSSLSDRVLVRLCADNKRRLRWVVENTKLDPNIRCYRRTNVFNLYADAISIEIFVVDNLQSHLKPSPLKLCRKVIGFAGFGERSPHQEYTNNAKPHADDSSGAHDIGPQGRLALSYKIALVSLVIALFVASLCRAVVLIDRGKAETGFPYLFVGVSGIFASMIAGLPLIFGGLP